jgi:hypothetical protein
MVLTGPVLETCCPANAARGEPPLSITMEKGKELIVFSVAWNAKVETQPKVGDIVRVHHWIGSDGRAGGVMYTASKIEAAKGPRNKSASELRTGRRLLSASSPQNI